MKHATDMKPSASRVFNLPLESFGGEVTAYELPTDEGERQPVPESFLTDVEFATRLLGNEVLFSNGRAYATDNKIACEYSLDRWSNNLAITAKQYRVIRSFGEAPNYLSVSNRLHLFWSDGRRLVLPPYCPDVLHNVEPFIESYDWNGLRKVTDLWRSQITGHFSYKPSREESGLIRILPEKIVGGIFDTRPDTELSIETFADEEVFFEKDVFLNAVKHATEVKFVHEGDHSRLLFRGERLRGVAASRHKLKS